MAGSPGHSQNYILLAVASDIFVSGCWSALNADKEALNGEKSSVHISHTRWVKTLLTNGLKLGNDAYG